MRRIILLTGGHSDPGRAKTAVNLIRYQSAEIAGVLDKAHAGHTTQSLFGLGGPIPVAATFDALPPADTVVIGIAPSGGQLPATLREQVLEAISLGMNVISGLHQFLSEDPEIAAHAALHGVLIQDVRKTVERDVANRFGINEHCLRIHTVGQDCNVGKMVVSVEITNALQERGHDAQFVATGQTGIMIQGSGCPIDAVASDFVSGAAEKLVLANQQHSILLIEGQGSIAHPRYSAVTLGLLHGCAPDGLILCYEMGRKHVAGMQGIALKSLCEYRSLYETMANLMHPCRVIGIAMNSRQHPLDEAEAERQRLKDQLGLPVCDVLRHGAHDLVQAVLLRGREVGKIRPPV